MNKTDNDRMATSRDLDLAAELVRESHPELAQLLENRADFIAEVEEDFTDDEVAK